MILMVAQVFNLCTGGVLLSHAVSGTGFQPVRTGQRPVPPVSSAPPGLTTEFGRRLSIDLFVLAYRDQSYLFFIDEFDHDSAIIFQDKGMMTFQFS